MGTLRYSAGSQGKPLETIPFGDPVGLRAPVKDVASPGLRPNWEKKNLSAVNGRQEMDK